MKIKDYKCKCGHNDFFFADKGSQKGIYCSYCGKWVKWADKDEQNLAMKQEPRKDNIETLIKYFLGLVEVLRLHGMIHYSDIALIMGTRDLEVLDIIDEFDKYRTESEET